MPMPSITVTFSQVGIASIQRSQKGVVAMIIQDKADSVQGGYSLTGVTDINKTLGALGTVNKAQINFAFMGYVNPPRKVLVYVMDGVVKTQDDALEYFATQNFDYIVGPHDIEPAACQQIASWIKSERLKNHTAKAVLPNCPADTEGVVNFATEKIFVGKDEHTTAQYCSRIAGLIAGTPMTISATYTPLPEATDCVRITDEEMDKAVDDGKFIVFYDDGVITGRAVNSLKTINQEKGNKFQKIKIVEVMDMMKNDIRTTARKYYIGKYSNSYDNKCLLITAIQGYLEQLESGSILAKGQSFVELDMEAQANYIKSNGIGDPDIMTEQDIKEADTGSIVFIRIRCKILDAIEDIIIPITI